MKVQQLLLLIGITLLLSACGKKGPVRPLDAAVPGSVSGAEIHQQGENLVLSWQLPKKNLDGSQLSKEPQLDLYRMVFDPTDDCPECTDRSSLVASIDPDLPAPARRAGQRYQYVDADLLAGKGYKYKLVPRENDLAGKAISLRRIYLRPAAAPEQLQATSQSGAILLTWLPPVLAPNETLLGYQLYRSLGGQSLSPALLNTDPLQTTRFEDFDLNYGNSYVYRVRALVKRGDQVLEGLASNQVAVMPKAGI